MDYNLFILYPINISHDCLIIFLGEEKKVLSLKERDCVNMISNTNKNLVNPVKGFPETNILFRSEILYPKVHVSQAPSLIVPCIVIPKIFGKKDRRLVPIGAKLRV